MSSFEKARGFLKEFKGNNYHYGIGVLQEVGKVARSLGKNTALVYTEFFNSKDYFNTVKESLESEGVRIVKEIEGPAPNAPIGDLERIALEISQNVSDVVISFGGGSTIDVTKAAVVICDLGGTVEDYFGTGLVTKCLEKTQKSLTPHIAIQTASSSGAHLTKYSNITNIETGQKKLIVDEAIVPTRSIFDYEVTYTAPKSLTADGALDGIAHSLEVLYGSVDKPYYAKMMEIAYECIRLIVFYLPKVIENPSYSEGREALGLATDLGGYSIMIGGTNGGHLTSFSLVDILSHGRACAIMNPYYTVFFAPNIEKPLKMVGEIFKEAGYTKTDLNSLTGRDLGMAVAEAMINFELSIGFPSTLGEVEGFTDAHIDRALQAAKLPQLKMKLENMPVSLTSEMVDDYMGPILQAAKTGDLTVIKNV